MALLRNGVIVSALLSLTLGCLPRLSCCGPAQHYTGNKSLAWSRSCMASFIAGVNSLCSGHGTFTWQQVAFPDGSVSYGGLLYLAWLVLEGPASERRARGCDSI